MPCGRGALRPRPPGGSRRGGRRPGQFGRIDGAALLAGGGQDRALLRLAAQRAHWAPRLRSAVARRRGRRLDTRPARVALQVRDLVARLLGSRHTGRHSRPQAPRRHAAAGQ